MIEIIYPTSKFFGGRAPDWYDYLKSGFVTLGSLVLSEELSKISTFKMNFCVAAIDIKINGKATRIWYDWSDFETAHKELMRSGDLYFKMQYSLDYIEDRSIYPTGICVIPIDQLQRIMTLRFLKDKRDYKYDLLGMFRTTNYDLRRKAVEIIRARNDWKSLSGLKWTTERPEVPRELQVEPLPYFEHLEAQCRSKICLSFPGVGTRFGFNGRFAELTAMGCCVMMPRPEFDMFGTLFKSAIIIERDLSDLEEKVDYYLKHDEEREEIAHNGLEIFDRWLSPRAIALDIVEKVHNANLLSG